ncbi:MAG: oxidoreductase [Ferruginibacter sp.]
MKKIFFAFLISFVWLVAHAQKVQVLVKDKKASLRGLCVVNDKVVWVSGSNGTVGRSIDGGDSWKWFTVKGFEKTDFRDIEAFDDMTAVIMGIAEPAYILKTVDGGENWKVVFQNNNKGMFLDAMEFWNEMSGIVIGDPVKVSQTSNTAGIFVARSFDGGSTWQNIPPQNYPVADSGEACFASSGTNIVALSLQEPVFVTGGLRSRMFIRDQKIDMPIIQGKETTGANSVAVKGNKKKKTIIVVGGDFTTPDSTAKNCVITTNLGKTFTMPSIPPHGYRSCVIYLDKNNWLTCGLNGVDNSDDDGNTWRSISKEGFHVCKKAKKGKAVFFAGGGKVGKLVTD